MRPKHFVLLIMVIIAAMLWLSMFLGCKAEHRLDKHPLRAATYCLNRFPPHDSTSIIERVVKGDSIVTTNTDTVTVSHTDTFNRLKTVFKYITKTETVRITDTLYKDRITTATDPASHEAYLLTKAKLSEVIDKHHTLKSWFIGISMLLFVIIALGVYRWVKG